MKFALWALAFLLSSTVFASNKQSLETSDVQLTQEERTVDYPIQLLNGTYSRRQNNCYAIVTYSPYREIITMRWRSYEPDGCKNTGDYDEYIYSGYGQTYYGVRGTDAAYAIEVLSGNAFVFINSYGTPNNMFTRDY